MSAKRASCAIKKFMKRFEKIVGFVQAQGFTVLGLDFSPIKGPEGNIEYLIYIEKSEMRREFERSNVQKVVTDSHDSLNGGE